MARFDATGLTFSFNYGITNLVSFASILNQSSTGYSYNTDAGGAVAIEGTGFTYSGTDPTNGAVSQVVMLVDNNLSPDIFITGLSANLNQLVNPLATDTDFAFDFWRELLEGNDLILAPDNQTFSMAGDGTSARSGIFTANDDRLVGGSGGASNLSQRLIGDVGSNTATLRAGNDVITGAGAFFNILVGDVDFNSGHVFGGDDVLTNNGSGGGIIYGDVRFNENFSTLVGGDDIITGSEASDLGLYGDVDTNNGWLVGGNDIIRGRGGDDSIHGDTGFNGGGSFRVISGGNDQLFGDAGNDSIHGGFGSDLIDGGADTDQAQFFDVDTSGAELIRVGGTVYVSQIASPDLDTDTLVNVETIRMVEGDFTVAALAEFNGLNYVARYSDLIVAFRGLGSAAAINTAGAQHYAFDGYFEGRAREGSLPFDPVQYKANYGDLAGLSDAVAAQHFIQFGFGEGRLGFDAMAYIASWSDLRAAFGTNEQAAVQHWETIGRFEGRTVSFDAKQYLDNYADIAGVLGANDVAGAASHFVQFGAAESRTDIDPLDYIASYGDLIQAFGDFGNAPIGGLASAGLQHYVQMGRAEGRDATFNAWQYLLNYDDLSAAFGTDVDAAAHHFVQFGFYEGRTDLDVFA